MDEEKGLDWLIDTAETEIQETIQELHAGTLTPVEKRGLRAVLQQLIGTLQKLYYQRNMERPSRETLTELIQKLPEKTAKRVEKAVNTDGLLRWQIEKRRATR